MRILLDESLSESIAPRIRSVFPDTEHVRRALGAGSTDVAVWAFAKLTGQTPCRMRIATGRIPGGWRSACLRAPGCEWQARTLASILDP